jgi:hypothetical protein
MPRHEDHRNVLHVVQRIVEQRSDDAAAVVAELRTSHRGAHADELADLLIRRCVRDLTISGAMTGGAAASPLAGSAVAAAGADSIYGVGRLSEMVMAIGLVYGHTDASAGERAGWIMAALGVSEATAMGVTGLAARVGARSGARLVSRLPGVPATGASAAAGLAGGAARRAAVGAAGRRAVARVASGKGPWSFAALVPYGIGAGVGAAGNALLARSVGATAKHYFRDRGAAAGPIVVDDDVIDVEVVEVIDEVWGVPADDDIVDAEVIDPRPAPGDRPPSGPPG